MDLYSRRIIGWSMSRRLSRHIAVNALSMALGQRRPGVDLIHHSDRGVQYLSDAFQALLKKYGTRDEARADVFDYIERFYNRKRRHGYVGNVSPVHYENRTLGLNSGVHQTWARPLGWKPSFYLRPDNRPFTATSGR